MQINIAHHTLYRYAQLDGLIIQALRLWPVHSSEQTIAEWQVSVDGKRLNCACTDGFGNQLGTHTIGERADSVRVSIIGRVETFNQQSVHVGGEPLPPVFFLAPTELTAATPAMVELAENVGTDGDARQRIDKLANLLRDRVDYQPQDMEIESTTAAILDAGTGGGQDHAHLLIAAARAIGFPARYAAGYLHLGESGGTIRHAWTEIFVPVVGWLGVDSAYRHTTNDHYIRVAVGRDSRDAAPVRAVLRGGLAVPLEVQVNTGQRTLKLTTQSQSQSGGEQSQQQTLR